MATTFLAWNAQVAVIAMAHAHAVVERDKQTMGAAAVVEEGGMRSSCGLGEVTTVGVVH